MRSLSKAETRDHLRHRLEALRPDAAPRWGRFTAPQMLAHLTQSLRMAMGELRVSAQRVPALLRHPPFKQIAVYLLCSDSSAGPAQFSSKLAVRGRGLAHSRPSWRFPAARWATNTRPLFESLQRFGSSGRPDLLTTQVARSNLALYASSNPVTSG